MTANILSLHNFDPILNKNILSVRLEFPKRMERRGKRANSHNEAEEARKYFEKSKNNLSDFDSSSDESGSYDELEDDDDFVVGGQYSNDYVPKSKDKAPKKAKTNDAPVQKSNLLNFIKNTTGSETTKPKTKSTSTKKNADIDIDSMLKELNDDDEDDDRRSRRKKKPQNKQANLPKPSFLRKQEEAPVFDNSDDNLPPPPPQPSTTSTTVAKPSNIEKTKPQLIEPPSEAAIQQVVSKDNKKKNEKVEKFQNFDIQQVSDEGLDITGKEVESIQKYDVDLPEDKSLLLYLFHIHEEGGKLYLFCKYLFKGNYITVCIGIGQVNYCLQFLPIPGHEDDLIEEVNEIGRKASFKVVKGEYQDKHYAFDKINIPNITKWYCTEVTPRTIKLNEIPQVGNHFSQVFGLTATLTENFLLKKRIKGPSWIKITEVIKKDQVSTCPTFLIKNMDSVHPVPENQQPVHVPPFNLCTFAMRTVLDEKNSPQILILSMKIHYYWNIETFTPSEKTKNYQKVITFACSTKNVSLSSKYVNYIHNQKKSNVVICANETDLLTKFLEQLDEYDIDLIASFGLTTSDLPLIYDKIVKHKIRSFFKLGRLKRREAKPKYDLLMALSGRLPVDLRVSCLEFLNSKVNDFSSIVKDYLNSERQVIDHYDLLKSLSNYDDVQNLINYSIRDTAYVSNLLQKIQVLPLTLQISKLSTCPWSRVLMGQATHRCEHLLLHNFSNYNYVLPEKLKTGNQNFKRESKYKGGMVLAPIRGFYDTCILVLDFNSLYPSIIREYNICFTTVDREKPNAHNSKNSPNKGILPSIMTELLESRAQIKAENRRLNDELLKVQGNEQKTNAIKLEIERITIKEKAVKVLANSIYGYLGYRGSRFQAKELAALITEQGRTILADTVKTMTNMCGTESAVIYGDTDSVMVNSGVTAVDDARKKAEELSRAISQKYKYLKLGIDYIFLKMLLVQKKKYAALVYSDNRPPQLQMKGLDMVRRDWSNLTKYLSSFIINQFMKDGQEKDQAVNNILLEMSAVSHALRNNGVFEVVEDRVSEKKDIKLPELLIFKALKKNVDQYDNSDKNPPHVAVAKRMKERGQDVAQGTTIGYYVCKADSKNISLKAKSREEVSCFDEIDVDWYLTNQLLHPLWRLCEPFGQMQISQIGNALGCHLSTPIDSSNIDIDNNPCFQIPRVVELIYKCRGCEKQNRITTKYHECLKCSCGYENNWKEVANQLTEYVRNFLISPKLKEDSTSESVKTFKCDGYLCTHKTAQLPVNTLSIPHVNGFSSNDKLCHGNISPIINNADIFNTLRYFKALFDPPKKGPEDFQEFREYMYSTMDIFYQTHGFTRVNFRALLKST
ncbi:DNA polymerase alpha catalytic subunit [Tritrichomonas foetus]|uniref:DNA polymerase n=1 Tax=Tritrichomonas foetus TaxID=1144522 RepID=A0A1J4K4J0_9EUKA|nr:DNA polymerase alpha catalytic subunit [Tritrichomonas foetus]|eukprot:OHT04413.1 DNA polymerase alpha catalytic subunit [Tritrichomonas foetus]